MEGGGDSRIGRAHRLNNQGLVYWDVPMLFLKYLEIVSRCTQPTGLGLKDIQ